MAGNYPDVPGNRIPYDRDGTAVFLNPSMTTAATAAQVQGLNSEAPYLIGRNFNATALTLLLPRPLDLVGLMVGYGGGYMQDTNAAVMVSSDTTNGVDGTWRSVTVTAHNVAVVVFRTGISAVSEASVIGIRVTYSTGDYYYVANLHVYGSPSTTPTNNLVLYDPTSDARVGGAYFDFGDVPQTTTADKLFRVHNNSATQTASTITISCETLTDTTPSVPPQFTFSTDGVTFASTVTLASLAPGTTSSTITVRRTTPSNAVLSLWWARIVASAASWV